MLFELWLAASSLRRSEWGSLRGVVKSVVEGESMMCEICGCQSSLLLRKALSLLMVLSKPLRDFKCQPIMRGKGFCLHLVQTRSITEWTRNDSASSRLCGKLSGNCLVRSSFHQTLTSFQLSRQIMPDVGRKRRGEQEQRLLKPMRLSRSRRRAQLRLSSLRSYSLYRILLRNMRSAGTFRQYSCTNVSSHPFTCTMLSMLEFRNVSTYLFRESYLRSGKGRVYSSRMSPEGRCKQVSLRWSRSTSWQPEGLTDEAWRSAPMIIKE